MFTFEVFKSTILIAGLVGLALLADYLVKEASLRPNGYFSWYFMLSLPLVCLAAAGWYQAMQMETLAGISILEASISIIGLSLLGLLIFKETLSVATIIAAGFALTAVLIQTIWG